MYYWVRCNLYLTNTVLQLFAIFWIMLARSTCLLPRTLYIVQFIHSSVLAVLPCTVNHSSVLALLSCTVYTQLGTCRTAMYSVYTARYLPYCHVQCIHSSRYLPYCHVQCIHSSVLVVLPCTVYTQLGTWSTATYSVYTARYLPYCHVQCVHS